MENGRVVDADLTDEEQVALRRYCRHGTVLPGHGDVIAAYRNGKIDPEAFRE